MDEVINVPFYLQPHSTKRIGNYVVTEGSINKKCCRFKPLGG